MPTFRQITSTLPPSIVTSLNNDDDPRSRVSIAASLNNDNDSARRVVLPRPREAVSPTLTIEYITAQEQITNIRGSTEQSREQPGRASRSTIAQTEVLPGRISASRISAAKPMAETKSFKPPMAEFTFQFPKPVSMSANNVPNVTPPPGSPSQRPYHLSAGLAPGVKKAQHSPDPSVSSYSNQVPFDLPYRLRSDLPRRLHSEQNLDSSDTKSVVESAVNLVLHPESIHRGRSSAAPSQHRTATKDGKSRFFPNYIAREREPSPPETAFRYPLPLDTRTGVTPLTPLKIDANSAYTSSSTPFPVFLAKKTHTIERNVQGGYRSRDLTSFPEFPWSANHDSVKKSEPRHENDVADDLPFVRAGSWIGEMTRMDGDEDQTRKDGDEDQTRKDGDQDQTRKDGDEDQTRKREDPESSSSTAKLGR